MVKASVNTELTFIKRMEGLEDCYYFLSTEEIVHLEAMCWGRKQDMFEAVEQEQYLECKEKDSEVLVEAEDKRRNQTKEGLVERAMLCNLVFT